MEELKKQVPGQKSEGQPEIEIIETKLDIIEVRDASSAGNSESNASLEYLKRNKKMWSYAIILIIGLAIGAGALSGYYERMFKNPLFAFRGKTWVSYEDPIVKMTIINDSKCEACNSEPLVNYLKSNIAATIAVDEISYDSQKGKDLISKFGIKSVPAFVFDSNVKNVKFFKDTPQEQMSQLFAEKDGQNYLNPMAVTGIGRQLGVDVGRYIELPQVSSSDRVKGPENAPVTIIEFSDFQCPYCKIASETMKQVLAAYPDKVRLVYKHLPISGHTNAVFAAEAAECAGDQNKFWEMSDLIFANQESLNKGTPEQYKDSVNKYASQLSLNTKDFESCLSANKYKAKVEADAALADSYGVTGTPAFFINGKLAGGGTLDQFKAVIDEQLKGK